MPRRVRPAQALADDQHALDEQRELEQRLERLIRYRVVLRPRVDGVSRHPRADDILAERDRMEREGVPVADQLARLDALLDEG